MSTVKHISDIDTATEYGQMLVAAISLLSTESLIPKSYNDAIKEVSDLAKDMYQKPEEVEEYTYSV